MKTQWEHLVHKLEFTTAWVVLNQLGKDGWELVAVVGDQDKADHLNLTELTQGETVDTALRSACAKLLYFFKRQRPTA